MDRKGAISSILPLEGGGKRVGVKELRDVARALRKRSTDTEVYLWRRFKKLVIEIDGGQHAMDSTDDKIRDEWLRGQGYRVLRFWDNEVFRNIEGVLEAIRDALVTPHPAPLPQREREDNFRQYGELKREE
jgi:very-short-patch-repair endonuclease